MTNTFVLWLTGLPASGKSDLAEGVASFLAKQQLSVELINSGKLRRTPLGATLGFSKHERETNVRRHAIAAKLLMQNGVVPIVSAVSPYRADRDIIRKDLEHFVEVYVSTPPEICQQLDKTGNWARALRGEIPNFTGISDPYEAPVSPEITVSLANSSVEAATQTIIRYLREKDWVPTPEKRPRSAEEIAKKLQLLGYSDQP